MKKLFFCMMIILLGCGLSNLVYAKELKIGCVDVVSVFNDYNKTKDYEKLIDDMRESKEKDSGLKEKKEEIMKMQEKVGLLKEKEQEAQREKIREAIAEYKNIESKILSELKKESDERMKEIVEDIEKVIKSYGDKNGFDLIVNKSVVLHSKSEMDITGEIINLLNKEYKK
ncbi:MAG: OmpH family outer membrane protein [Candidatus Omnitrophica bacterium]|nr:OmpH family outer membrane protein [Candidatus Omnitrophota bacterium]